MRLGTGIRLLQRLVSSVAHRLCAALLAAAEPNDLAFGRLIGHRYEAGVLVRAVAKWLFLAAPAGAPRIFAASLDLGLIGGFLWADRLCHTPSFIPPTILLSAAL